MDLLFCFCENVIESRYWLKSTWMQCCYAASSSVRCCRFSTGHEQAKTVFGGPTWYFYFVVNRFCPGVSKQNNDVNKKVDNASPMWSLRGPFFNSFKISGNDQENVLWLRATYLTFNK